MKKCSLAVCIIAIRLAGTQHSALAGVKVKVDYARDVKPIFHEKCYVCHGQGQQNHGLRLDEKASAIHVLLSDGKAEPILVRRITNAKAELKMPPVTSGYPLTAREIETLVSWVKQGALWPEEIASLCLSDNCSTRLIAMTSKRFES
jgi:uncharacterized membrane protein